MTGSLNFPVFLYSLLAMLGLGTFLSEARNGPQTAILICGFYLAAACLQRWFFDPNQMFRKKSKSEAVDQIIFAGEELETEAGAALEKRTLDRVLKLPVQIKLRIGMFGMVGFFVSLVLNHTLTMHFTLFFHLVTALLLLPAMTPNHFMLPCIVNLLGVGYGFATSDTPDFFLYSVYVLVFMFVLMTFGNVQREMRQTHPVSFPVVPLTIRTAVSAVQTGVAYLLLMGIVDHFVPHPGKAKLQQRGGIKTTMVQVQAMLGRAMPDAFRPAPGASGAPNPAGQEDPNGMKAKTSPEGGGQIPSGTPAEGPSARPAPSAPPSTAPSAKPSARPSTEPQTSASPSPFPLPATMPSLSPEQIQSLAREALKQGLFNEQDLKRGELNLKPEVQKLLSPERVKMAMEDLKKMSEAARTSQLTPSSRNSEGKRPQEGKQSDPARPRADGLTSTGAAPREVGTSPDRGTGRDGGGTREDRERREVEQAISDILKSARTAIADAKSHNERIKQGDQGLSGAGGREERVGGGGGTVDKDSKGRVDLGTPSEEELFRRQKRKLGGTPGGAETIDDSLLPKMIRNWATKVGRRYRTTLGRVDFGAMMDDLFTPILLALVFGVIWFFRRKLRKKADPRRVSRAQLARDQRIEILKRLKELGAGGLSAREEVIARYDLFLRIMELAATPRETYLPPTDFQRRIRYLHPPLEGQSKQLTDIFCDVLYGDISAGANEVNRARGAVKEIFHYFAE